MNQGHVAAMGVMALLFAGATGLIWTMANLEMSLYDDPDAETFRSTTTTIILTTGIVIVAMYGAAAMGLHNDAPWARALTFFLQPLTTATLIGIPLVIWQLVTLTKHAPQR